MNRKIQVTPDELISAAGKIETLANEYREQYEQLYTETSAMGSQWTGKDNTAFVNQIDGYRDDLDKMYKLMLNYASFLRNSARAYAETQEQVRFQATTLTN